MRATSEIGHLEQKNIFARADSYQADTRATMSWRGRFCAQSALVVLINVHAVLSTFQSTDDDDKLALDSAATDAWAASDAHAAATDGIGRTLKTAALASSNAASSSDNSLVATLALIGLLLAVVLAFFVGYYIGSSTQQSANIVESSQRLGAQQQQQPAQLSVNSALRPKTISESSPTPIVTQINRVSALATSVVAATYRAPQKRPAPNSGKARASFRRVPIGAPV